LILLVLEPDASSLTDATRMANERMDALKHEGRAVRSAAFISTTPGEDIVRVASEQDVDLVVIDALGDIADDLGQELLTVLERAPCDVAVLIAGHGVPATGGGAVLVPFGGAEHEWAAMEIGAWIAGATGARLELLGTVADSETGQRDASRLLATASLVLQKAAGVTAEPRLVAPGPDSVIDAARRVDVVVVGLSDRWRQQGAGADRLAVATRASAPVLLVRGGVRPGGLAPHESLTRFTWTMASAS
jgi:hypothetical protein